MEFKWTTDIKNDKFEGLIFLIIFLPSALFFFIMGNDSKGNVKTEFFIVALICFIIAITSFIYRYHGAVVKMKNEHRLILNYSTNYKDIDVLRQLVEELLRKKNVEFTKLDEKQTLEKKYLHRYMLVKQGIEISIDILEDLSGFSIDNIQLSIYPCNNKNSDVVEDWKKNIEASIFEIKTDRTAG